LGLLVWLVLLSATGFAGGVPGDLMLPMLALGLFLTAAGLLSSTLHLANPKNAWRAFSQFRTSWLSREGVLAVAIFPVAAVFGVLSFNDAPTTPRAIAGGLLALLALGILYCTGMIYACLKTIPRWHTRLVPAGYVLLGLYSGALAGLPFLTRGFAEGASPLALAIAPLLAALIVKAVYYFRFRVPDARFTRNDALPLGKKTIRLLDVGHTHGTFLTDEFYFKLARGHAQGLRIAAVGLGFALPLLILVSGTRSAVSLAIAAVACLLGLLAERWLFFAEAEHVVRLYHGAARV
jgi:DMSO reductase anchor subunit